MNEFEKFVDLASERLGGAVLAASDEFFAEKENLLKDAAPIWVADRYTDRGKWMDGWETRRRRTPGHDWCVVRLGLPGVVHGVIIDTAFFLGNYPETAWLEGAAAPRADLEQLLSDDATRWHEILPRVPLQGDHHNAFAVSSPWRFTHLRLHIDPDGGVARLRVHGKVVPELEPLAGADLVDLAALEHGAAVTQASDMFFGSRHHLVLPGPSRGMHDGWETRRRRGPGHDWAVVRLAAQGVIERAVVDTTHFKGNAPGQVALDVGSEASEGGGEESIHWHEILPQTAVRPDGEHRFDFAPGEVVGSTHARLRIYPDGGVARLRLLGRLTEAGFGELAMRRLDALAPEEAEATFRSCLASDSWAYRLADGRPYRTSARLLEAAERAWEELAEEDWERAFAAHPRIGESVPSDPAHAASEAERRWSAAEQSAAASLDPAVQQALAEGNRRYEERFGRVFLIHAAGQSAARILAALEKRLQNDAATERQVSIGELTQIARRRLERMLAP